MRIYYPLFILFCVLFFALSGSAQYKKDSTFTGILKGVVKDSAYNYRLQSATVAVYTVSDSALVSYQLSNNFGEFEFKELPAGIPLRIIASYIGYKNTSKQFTIPAGDHIYDLKNINLFREEKTDDTGLEDVIVKSVPPVQMNGDTLEFNAEAFKMDPNAVTEDLLRRLPGVVVWGDGSITVNGREVSRVLVNGKPFFGGDTRVATQNLPKNAVEKVQVYQQRINNNNPLDSITEVNIQLKKGKEIGRFGKLAAGVGTDRHYEADASINFYTNRTQLGIVGGLNDINKVANDVGTLMRSSTYKGVGASIEYQPDFTMQGLNLPRAAGFTFQQDFIDHPDFYQNNRLSGNYFIHNNTQKLSRQTREITSLGGDSTQTRQDYHENKHAVTGQRFNANYNKHIDHYTYDFTVGLQSETKAGNSEELSETKTSAGTVSSNNSVSENTRHQSKGASLNAHISHSHNYYAQSGLNQDWDIHYSLNVDDKSGRDFKKTSFISLSDTAQNQFVDRKYHNENSGLSQFLSVRYGSLSKWILPRRLRSVNTSLNNTLRLSSRQSGSQVFDLDSVTELYKANRNLSGSSHYSSIDERPSLEFSRNIIKSLANRYNKTLRFVLTAEEQFFYQRNRSVHEFQNIVGRFQIFVPSASVHYENHQYGAFDDQYTLSFQTGAVFPGISQLAPLVDSSNLYAVIRGNPYLKHTYKKELSFDFRHSSNGARNPFNYTLSVQAGKIHNSFADSTVIDTLGRRTHYTVNLDGYRYLNGTIRINKAFKLKNHQLQVSYNGGVQLSRNPSYVNSALNLSENLSTSQSLTLHYNLKDLIAVNLQEQYSHYRSEQTGAGRSIFRNTMTSTRFSASVKCTRRLTVGSNMTYNHAASSRSDPTDFTIWNAQAYYRFFQGNNLELKFSALDLLHQNTSIIHYGHNNVIGYGRVNVLQNYYMVTLSFFPRKFGKNK